MDESTKNITDILRSVPDAYAIVNGSSKYPDIHGIVSFYQVGNAVLLMVSVKGLPDSTDKCAPDIFAFHIHEGRSCTGVSEDPFKNAGGHYNPDNCPHPAHAGDLPPLFGNNGYAFMVVMTGRFTVNEVIGRTVIIHAKPDDFTTQPSGNSGEKIACGIIMRTQMS